MGLWAKPYGIGQPGIPMNRALIGMAFWLVNEFELGKWAPIRIHSHAKRAIRV